VYAPEQEEDGKPVARMVVYEAIVKTAQAQEKTTILFVCEHGAAKSVIAAAEFNRLAKERGLPYRAIARGVHPDPKIPASVTEGLAADGLDAGSSKPTLVTDKDIRGSKRVITLGCLLPPSKSAPKAATQDWKEIPNVFRELPGGQGSNRSTA